MKSKDLESIIDTKDEPEKKLADIEFYLFMLLVVGAISTISNKLQQNVEFFRVKYHEHQKFIIFCICLFFLLVERRSKKG